MSINVAVKSVQRTLSLVEISMQIETDHGVNIYVGSFQSSEFCDMFNILIIKYYGII